MEIFYSNLRSLLFRDFCRRVRKTAISREAVVRSTWLDSHTSPCKSSLLGQAIAICMHAVCASINARTGTTNIAGHRVSVRNEARLRAKRYHISSILMLPTRLSCKLFRVRFEMRVNRNTMCVFLKLIFLKF